MIVNWSHIEIRNGLTCRQKVQISCYQLNSLTKPIRSTFTYGTYGIAGTKVKSMMSDEAADAVERVKLENEKIKKEKDTKEKKIYKKKAEETTLGEIDINTIVDQEHKWIIDNSGNYVVD